MSQLASRVQYHQQLSSIGTDLIMMSKSSFARAFQFRISGCCGNFDLPEIWPEVPNICLKGNWTGRLALLHAQRPVIIPSDTLNSFNFTEETGFVIIQTAKKLQDVFGSLLCRVF